MIEVEGVSHFFQNASGRVEVLDRVGFAVEKGSFTSIVGPSGCGKTTLLKIIASLLEPSGGAVKIDGTPSRRRLSEHPFGFVFQEPALLPWATVLKNIQLPGEILGIRAAVDRAAGLVELVGLKGFENARPHELSGGMKARVALARALSFHPAILLMDEPFGNLDELTRDAMNFELMNICREIETTVLFVTHNISEAVLLSDQVVVLSGRPARAKKAVRVDFPRPRDAGLRRTPEFVKKVEDLREVLLGA